MSPLTGQIIIGHHRHQYRPRVYDYRSLESPVKHRDAIAYSEVGRLAVVMVSSLNPHLSVKGAGDRNYLIHGAPVCRIPTMCYIFKR